MFGLPGVKLTELSRLADNTPSYECGSLYPDFPLLKLAENTFMKAQDLVKMTKLFFEIFAEPVKMENFVDYSFVEINAVSIAVISDRISRFLAEMLKDPDVPVTANSVSFLLEIWIFLNGDPPGSSHFRVMVSSFLTRKNLLTRRQLTKILCEKDLAVFFSTDVAATLPKFMNTSTVGDLKLPMTWTKTEAPGKFLFTKKDFFDL